MCSNKNIHYDAVIRQTSSFIGVELLGEREELKGLFLLSGSKQALGFPWKIPILSSDTEYRETGLNWLS